MFTTISILSQFCLISKHTCMCICLIANHKQAHMWVAQVWLVENRHKRKHINTHRCNYIIIINSRYAEKGFLNNNNLKLFLLVISIPIIVGFEVDEETRKHLYNACGAANEDIQRNGILKEPHPTYPQISIPSSSVVSPTALFAI